jgi:large subunit ribosomal protein L9
MKALLSKAVPNVGNAGDVVEVSPGYFRNFLLPRRLATEATDKNIQAVVQTKKAEERLAQREKADARVLAGQLANVPVKVKIKAGENDRLFGSVTAADIAEKLAAAGYEIDKRKIVLDEPIKRLGLFTVHIKLHHDVEAKITVLVDRA